MASTRGSLWRRMAFGSSELTLQQITNSLAKAWEHVDASRPRNRICSPGLGPFDEREVVRLLPNLVQEDLTAESKSPGRSRTDRRPLWRNATCASGDLVRGNGQFR